MAPKISKNQSRFDLICREIDSFDANIKECDENDQARISVLRTKVQLYEKRLTDSFSDLSNMESDDNFEKYMKYQDNLLNWSVDLENAKTIRGEAIVQSETKQSVIKLPKFDLPHFYGDTGNWISFKELFNASVLQNKQLTEVEKLQYLQSSVRGNASKLIRGFAIQEQNLKNCWEILCQRYENKRQLALCQINKIFSVRISKANNSKMLLDLLDTCNEAIRNLKTLGMESNSLSDLMVINFMVSKLEEPIKQRWELSLESDIVPDLNTFRAFIEREARSLNEVKYSKPDNKFNVGKKPVDSNIVKKPIINNAVVLKGNSCLSCNQSHQLFRCPKFNGMTIEERWKFVNSNELCPNCLRNNHKLEACRININCKNCSERHHTLLHVYAVNTNDKRTENSVVSVSNSVQCPHNAQICNILLSTALIKVKSKTGKLIQCRALIDNASQNSLISRECAERLQLPLQSTTHRLVGINGMLAETSLHLTEFSFYPHFSSESYSVEALVVKQVTSPLPNFTLDRHDFPHLKHLVLADPKFYMSSKIDILLGADIFATLINGNPIFGQAGEPVALQTKLGYILSGQVDARMPGNSSLVCHTTNHVDETLKTFWALESIPKPEIKNKQDELCEEYFNNTIKRDSTGKYIVKLPFKEDKELGESKERALQRFHLLEKKLTKQPKFNSQYLEFMEEYASLGHMTPLSPDKIKITPNFFLPHHGVINENSTTTKLRVVFDASAKTTNGKSLNDVLLKGPKLQKDIFETLIKFRSYPVAFSSDIAKMYRQILMAEEDRQYQLVFWRKNPSDPLVVYMLNTVTYGTACAPYLALRTLKQLCHDEEKNFPVAAKIAREHFYVDDLLAGADSVDSARAIIHELQELMAAGGFPLRKWSCSHPEALSNLPDELKTSSLSHFFQEESSQKILGIFWNLKQDTLQIRTLGEDNVSTKRQLLSVIARTFDPLGLISPSTIILKLLLQELWKSNITWDEPVPQEIHNSWLKFLSEVSHLKEIQIPRNLHIAETKEIELHGFCDASPRAYAAVVYLRAISDSIQVTLVAAKTRVAPVQPVTLPRLELCGALLLSELIVAIQKSISFPIDQTFLWCDSTITLSWITNPPTKGNQFVQHRVEKIRSLTSVESWRHVPGKANPADCATRGLFPNQLRANSEWWTGPPWLHEQRDFPSSSGNTLNVQDCISCETENNCFMVLTDDFSEVLNKFSSYLKLVRVVAWLLRFYHNTKSSSKLTGPLKALELDQATKRIVKKMQELEFSDEIKLLTEHKPLSKSSKLISLNVFLDSDGILRVGGRLRKHQTFEFDQKFPMIIPKKHHITSLIIRHFHKSSLHAGPELVLSLIRQKFWIPDGRSTVRKQLRQCVPCFRFSAKPSSQMMGDLPSSRITPARPFEKVGIDFAGPINTKCQHQRKSTIFKSYLCLFICMCTKAVHLEVVSSLSTDSFLAALRRFIARRGYPTDIFTDNGKNFVGANAYLKSLFRLPKNQAIQNFCSEKNISWHFIPPYTPQFGGLWEASIKLAKRHLFKTCKGVLLTFEELTTLLCQVESCINSRPLVPLSTETTDLRALTPGHFLIGVPLLEIPEHKSNNCSISLSSRYKAVLQMKEKFWTRWSRDYLNTLQARPKGHQPTRSIQVGDLVIVKDLHLPPLQWTLGRVSSVFPGTDKLVRVVQVQTASGTCIRPVTRLAVLPTSFGRPPEDVGLNEL